MSVKSTVPDHDVGASHARVDTSRHLVADLALVLIVGVSNVNRVVVTRIIERAGLRALAASPEEAARTLGTTYPGTVILDGGPENRDCESLVPLLVTMRSRNTPKVPSVILLSTRKVDAEQLSRLEAVDAVVAKPILPELLQPAVEHLLQFVRHSAKDGLPPSLA